MADDDAPNRMTMTNMRTGVTREPQFNPEQVTEEIEANYSELQILGYSHKLLQFQGTGNLKLSFELQFDAQTANGGGGGGGNAHVMRQFLMGMCLPRADAANVSSGGPARCLFVWPEMWSFQCFVKKVSNEHMQFARTGKSRIFTSKVELWMVSDFRILADDVEDRGFVLPGG